MITIIRKVELGENNETITTDVGYTTDKSLIDSINIDYDSSLGKFFGENLTKLDNNVVSISDFFDVTGFVHRATTQVSSLEGLDLSEITNVNQL